jgi:hypothetical protein
MNPKILAILIVVIMLSALSMGDIPEEVKTTKTIDAIYEAIPSDTVWEDSFFDEDISDWQIFKVNHTTSPDTLIPGNTTACLLQNSDLFSQLRVRVISSANSNRVILGDKYGKSLYSDQSGCGTGGLSP